MLLRPKILLSVLIPLILGIVIVVLVSAISVGLLNKFTADTATTRILYNTQVTNFKMIYATY